MLLVPMGLSVKTAGRVWGWSSTGRARGFLGSIAGTMLWAPSTIGASFAPSTLSGMGFAMSGRVPMLLPKPSSPSFIFSKPARGFCSCFGAAVDFAAVARFGATGWDA